VEKQLRRAGDSPLQGPYEAQQVPADDSRERKRTGQLNIYYDAVIASIREADSLLIFGPGEAKGELAKRLERSHFSGRIVGSETADKMTHRQIAAKGMRTHHLPKEGEGTKNGCARTPECHDSGRRQKRGSPSHELDDYRRVP
jgi:hypothetical protein